MDRFDVLRSLLSFDKPVYVLANSLSKLDWDYEDKPLVITTSHIKEVLNRFIVGELSAQELEEWANLIEFREDLDLEEGRRDETENIIHRLANPVLEGEITIESCRKILSILDYVDG